MGGRGVEEVIELVLSWVVQTALVFAVVLFDERRLSEEQLERAWPPATRDLSLVWLGVLALPFHFARTRGTWTSAAGVARRVLGFVLGVAVAIVVMVASGLLVWGFAVALSYALDMPALRQ